MRIWIYFIFIGLLSLRLASANANLTGAEGTTPSFQALLTRLNSSKTGRALLEQARKLWKADSLEDLTAHLKWGTASRTDAVLIRRFDPVSAVESRDREITIYLRTGQKPDELLLDLAHELVHATSRPEWDPYDAQLTVGQYIENAIEGKGGEIQAVRSECKVAQELALLGGYGSSRARCGSDSTLLDDFYRVGKARDYVLKQLGAEASRFPKLSEKPVVLYSSTGRAPYPVALMQEFQAISRAACANMSRLAERQKIAGTRQPASENTVRFLARRCSN
jgi:hypothetical protein